MFDYVSDYVFESFYYFSFLCKKFFFVNVNDFNENVNDFEEKKNYLFFTKFIS